MNTMIVYDETGKIWFTMSGDELPTGCRVLNAEVPEGYTVASVDTGTGEPVLQKNPPTLEERIAELEAVNAALLGEE